MEMVQEMWGPEGVSALLIMVVIVGREWRRVQLARERRREREQELLAEMVRGVAEGDREVRVHHGGAAGAWSLTGTAGSRPTGTAGSRPTGRAVPFGDAAPVRGRTVAARRRR
ncbi:hypothetical protein [Streptomyces sp. NRRL S-1521]|uniref:hypothetical protein n=1 Tax=Streptomyces sp. NRRL S-1521 TaxID=1609100 RepID=UPI00074AF499|nr:hypothetical protein [Streptomyces sp. NRRL S-1521]KUL48992.1 hypothetical protein ADL30_34560 [Streptomyces sp. NRRL S-1521]